MNERKYFVGELIRISFTFAQYSPLKASLVQTLLKKYDCFYHDPGNDDIYLNSTLLTEA